MVRPAGADEMGRGGGILIYGMVLAGETGGGVTAAVSVRGGRFKPKRISTGIASPGFISIS